MLKPPSGPLMVMVGGPYSCGQARDQRKPHFAHDVEAGSLVVPKISASKNLLQPPRSSLISVGAERVRVGARRRSACGPGCCARRGPRMADAGFVRVVEDIAAGDRVLRPEVVVHARRVVVLLGNGAGGRAQEVLQRRCWCWAWP